MKKGRVRLFTNPSQISFLLKSNFMLFCFSGFAPYRKREEEHDARAQQRIQAMRSSKQVTDYLTFVATPIFLFYFDINGSKIIFLVCENFTSIARLGLENHTINEPNIFLMKERHVFACQKVGA